MQVLSRPTLVPPPRMWTECWSDSCCWGPVSIFQQLKSSGCKTLICKSAVSPTACAVYIQICRGTNRRMCWGMFKPLRLERYLHTLFNPKPLKWCIVFLCIVVGFIFSRHWPVRLWNAVFIEAVTVEKMTGVWSHPVRAPPILLRGTLLQWEMWDSVQQGPE